MTRNVDELAEARAAIGPSGHTALHGSMTADLPGSGRRVAILMRSPGYVRNFESILRALARRGHEVTVLFEERKVPGDTAGLALIARLSEEFDALDFEFLPLPLGHRARLRVALQVGQDYLRYFEPHYGDDTGLRARVLGFLPRAVERALSLLFERAPRLRRGVAAAARGLDRRLGDDPRIRHELEQRCPAALVVTPMVHFGSRQSSWVRAARNLGIPSVLCVHSWDSLVNKGLLHTIPDRVVVWNEIHARQATELHGAPQGSVCVAGAWPFEHWRHTETSRSREDFLSELGLAPDRALILYAGSSSFIAGNESRAFLRWLRALRACRDGSVATANVIVRPHPLNADGWEDVVAEDLEGVRVFPQRGQEPADESSRADYFDSIAHANAVVAINTSALIESSIIGRPALTFPGPDFWARQSALPHFRHLVGGQGILLDSSSMDEHLDELAKVLGGRSTRAAARRRFVDEFARANGNGTPPSERVAGLIEEVLGTGAVAALPRA